MGSHSVGGLTLGTQDLLHQDVQKKCDLAEEQQENKPITQLLFLRHYRQYLPLFKEQTKIRIYCSYCVSQCEAPREETALHRLQVTVSGSPGFTLPWLSAYLLLMALSMAGKDEPIHASDYPESQRTPLFYKDVGEHIKDQN